MGLSTRWPEMIERELEGGGPLIRREEKKSVSKEGGSKKTEELSPIEKYALNRKDNSLPYSSSEKRGAAHHKKGRKAPVVSMRKESAGEAAQRWKDEKDGEKMMVALTRLEKNVRLGIIKDPEVIRRLIESIKTEFPRLAEQENIYLDEERDVLVFKSKPPFPRRAWKVA